MKKIILFTILLWCMSVQVRASEIMKDKQSTQVNIEDKLMEDLHLKDINQVLDDIFPREKLDFTETVKSIIEGKTQFTVSLLGRLLNDQLFYEFQYNQKNLTHIIILAIMAAVLSNFSRVFQNRQISEISFYMIYLLLLTICLDSFRVVVNGVGNGLDQLLDFMRVLSPAYFLAVGIASGGSTAVVFYNIVLFLIYIIELVITGFLIPLIHVYIMIEVVNHLSLEDSLSRFAELLHMLIGWTLKTLLTCVVGLNVIQGLIMPVVDSLKRTTITKTAEAIPGIGDAIGGVAEVVMGTTILVKNGIGVAGAIICIIICLSPLIQMAIMTVFYKLIAAVIQPISDKRIVSCIHSIGEGYQLLLRVIFTVGILFLLTIAVVTSTTT